MAKAKKPVRLQLSRRKGFDLQRISRRANGLPAFKVTRPSVFGNPFAVSDALARGLADDKQAAHDLVIDLFRDWLTRNKAPRDLRVPDLAAKRKTILSRLGELEGRNLACWCRADESCHADVLIALANKSQ